MEMTAELMAVPSPQVLLDSYPVKPEDGSMFPVAAKETKQAKQRYVVNEIKKLIEGCDDFVGLVAGEKGEPEILSSPNLEQHKYTILGDAHGNFAQYMSNSVAPTRRASKIHKQASESSNMPSGSISYTFQRPQKRHRSRTINPRNWVRPKIQQNSHGLRLVCETPASQIRVDDREKLEQWFEQAFLTLQQVACRLVAKIWIKKIHPKKMSSTASLTTLVVRVRIPNHLYYDLTSRSVDRTSLLVHLILGTPQPIITNPPDPQHQQTVTAADLLECLEVKRDELREDRWEILEQITRARQMMEQYEAGEIDGDALVFLNDYSDGLKLTPHDSEDDAHMHEATHQGASSDGSHDEESAVGPDFTPASSAQNSPHLNADGSLPTSRLRAAMVGESVKNRRIGGRRPRAMANLGRVTTTISQQHPHELQNQMAMDVSKGDYQSVGAMNDLMLQEPTIGVTHPHCSHGSIVGIPPQISPNMFEGALDRHTGERDVTTCLPPQGHRPQGFVSQAWSGLVPHGGSELEQIFGITPQMITNPEMGHTFFGHFQHDMGGGMHTGQPLMSPLQYRDHTDGHQRILPLRVIQAQQSGAMTHSDNRMDMLAGHFYRP
ncbi:hypothetical protein HRR78_008521 [Exophiala dermatitidis]|nr:hypothetical protein HRR78_008521 [Exophiala dermatitidis]